MVNVPAAVQVPAARRVGSVAPGTGLAPVSVCLVGAGPRALGILDRLGAHASRLQRSLKVHVVDPYPAGSGRIWRGNQHPLLWMNSRAADVTVLPDNSSTLPEPVRTGPTLYAWLDAHREALAAQFATDGSDALHSEVLSVTEGTFVSRALGSHYLRWAWQEVVAHLPSWVTVDEHRTRVLNVTDADTTDGPQVVHLEDRAEPLVVDAVVLAQGHPDVRPGPREIALQQFADRHGLGYVAPAYTNDLDLENDLSAVRPGEDVIVAGMGLAFVDLMVLLAEGRGGHFAEDPESGRPVYRPAGAEPVLHVGSRRGVPYRSKITYELHTRPPLPRFLTAETAAARSQEIGEPLDLRADVWPLVAKELAGAYYHELFASHPQRTTMPAAEFDHLFAPAAWGSAELDQLIRAAVPGHADRLDLRRLDRPLQGWWGGSGAQAHDRVRAHIAADVARRQNPEFSPDAALFLALLSCYRTVADLSTRGLLTAKSSAVDVDGWWHGFFSYVASGPPPQRLRQLLALADAGVVRFLGGEMRVSRDECAGLWTARSGNGPHLVSARVLIDARLPSPSIRDSADPLLRSLSARGESCEQRFVNTDGPKSELSNGRLVVDNDQRLVHHDGTVHPRRFAAGPWVAGGGWAPAFARPGLDAGFFHLNDRISSNLLRAVQDTEESSLSPRGRPSASRVATPSRTSGMT